MLRNDSDYSIMIPSLSPPQSPPRQHANNDFDDVFGSAPASPSYASSQTANTDRDPFSVTLQRQGNAEPSDINRLRSTHNTAGYREGLATAKNLSIQAGFDEGFSLGATVGLRVGIVLGILEGILEALKKGSDVEQGRMVEVVGEARRELTTENVFGKDYWGSDGVWKYEVPGEENEGMVTWVEVVDAHPLVLKWERVMKQEAQRWGVSLEGLEKEDEDEDGGESNNVALEEKTHAQLNDSASVEAATTNDKIEW